MKVDFGRIARIAGAIGGIALLGWSIYWLGRSDQVQEFLDVAADDGGVTIYCHDRICKHIVPVHISRD